jgi:DNA-binding IclR family transcriptional regulator
MRTVRTVERALALLRMIAVSPESMTFGQLHKASELPKASAHNLLTTLEESGFVFRDGNGRYTPGRKRRRRRRPSTTRSTAASTASSSTARCSANHRPTRG